MIPAPTPSTENLRCFVMAAKLLNFRAAASRVALSPAAFGQRVRQLEEEMGVPLFQRSTRSISLTEAGARLLPHAHATLEDAARCVRAARGDLRAPDTELLLGTRHELGLSWLVPALPKLERAMPELTVNFYFGSGFDLAGSVASHRLDGAIMSTRLTDPKLDWFTLHEERYVLVAHPKLLKEHRLRNADDAGHHVLIDIDATLPLFRYWRDAPGGFDSRAFRSVRRMGTIAAIRALVLRAQGVAVLPEYFVERDLAKRRLVRILSGVHAVSDSFRLVFRADDPRRQLFESITKALREWPLK